MSPYILVLLLKMGFGATVTAVDVPSKAVCEREAARLVQMKDTYISAAYCVNRE